MEKIPEAIMSAARGHVASLESEGYNAAPSDAFDDWDAVSLPQVPGKTTPEIRVMLAQAIEIAIEENC